MLLIGRTRRYQRGYLREVPLLMMAVSLVTALLWPVLPGWAAQVMLGFAGLVWIGGLYYMWWMPGWQPGNRPSRRPNRGRVWIGLALLILIGGGLALLISASSG